MKEIKICEECGKPMTRYRNGELISDKRWETIKYHLECRTAAKVRRARDSRRRRGVKAKPGKVEKDLREFTEIDRLIRRVLA